ncbi:hypothetical protein WBG83_16215 [Paenibacillus sp. y28]
MKEITIPNGEQKITVELTLKEALALTGGARYGQQNEVVLNARKKLRRTVEETLIPEHSNIDYHVLEH